jgi:hypothetical protein
MSFKRIFLTRNYGVFSPVAKIERGIIKLIFQNFLIPLRAKQVSKANLHSEQGGINFTPFVLYLPYAKKKKKKKI